MKRITSQQNPRLKAAIRLKTSRGRKVMRRIIVFGFREIQRSVNAGIVPIEVFVCRERLEPHHMDWLANLEGPVTTLYDLPVAVFDKLKYGERDEGVVAVAPRPALKLSKLEATKTPLVVVLESIEKPGNIGAVLRSADGAGASGLVLTECQCDPLHPNSIRASQGAVFSMPMAIANNDELLAWIHQHQLQIVIASDQGATTYHELDFTKPTALILGNEASGVSGFWTHQSDAEAAAIPMRGDADSLNISVAAGVFLFEVARQRELAGR